jgi:hypothetical protein
MKGILMMEEVKEHVEWLGTAPSGRKIGRIVDKGGFARYITLETTPGIKYRYNEVYDNKNVTADILHAIALEYERATCIGDALSATAQKIQRDHFSNE